ncbi:MAG: glutamate carboxypeptidase [Verrucomicrobia bacterium]|nr:MAG: glutamate carboxypeptidase [Verrucomicrobiota bacterium]
MTVDEKTSLNEWLSGMLPEAMGWLQEMVGINSFTTNRAGVDRVGAITAKCFSELGFSPEFVPSEDPNHGDHLFLSCGNPELRPVILVTHLDTVFSPEEEKKNAFHWLEAPLEGRIYGPGTVDIKGGTILIWMLLRALQKARPEVFEQHHWLVAANASEEVIGAEFGRRTAERAIGGARAVLVFEGGPREGDDFHVVTARKGRALYRLHAEGRSAHAGSAHAAGANAIVTLAGAVQAAARVTDYAKDLTVNVGSIGGGSVVNRVPQEAWADLEMRAFSPEILEAARCQIEALAAAPASPSEARILVNCTGTSPAWPASSSALELLQHWRAAATALGIKIKNVSRGGLSDANYLCTLGPTLDGLGPSGANAHCSERTDDGIKVPEYVEPGSFAPKVALNLLAVCRMLSVEDGHPL